MSSTDPVRVLVIGDPYMPSSAYAEPLAGLGDLVEVTSMQIEGVGVRAAAHRVGAPAPRIRR